MLNLAAIRLVVRSRARAVAVVTTGLTTLTATATGYTRAAGSFFDDGFWPGMEVRPAGFANAAPGTITKVSPLALEIRGGRVAEAAAPNRALTVGLPSAFQFEGATFESTTGVPFATEQLMPGPASMQGGGPSARITTEPMYVVACYLPESSQVAMALDAYVTALVRHFPPGLPLPLANGDVVRVREDMAPFGGQLLAGPTGFVARTVSIPLRITTTNSI